MTSSSSSSTPGPLTRAEVSLYREILSCLNVLQQQDQSITGVVERSLQLNFPTRSLSTSTASHLQPFCHVSWNVSYDEGASLNQSWTIKHEPLTVGVDLFVGETLHVCLPSRLPPLTSDAMISTTHSLAKIIRILNNHVSASSDLLCLQDWLWGHQNAFGYRMIDQPDFRTFRMTLPHYHHQGLAGKSSIFLGSSSCLMRLDPQRLGGTPEWTFLGPRQAEHGAKWRDCITAWDRRLGWLHNYSSAFASFCGGGGLAESRIEDSSSNKKKSIDDLSCQICFLLFLNSDREDGTDTEELHIQCGGTMSKSTVAGKGCGRSFHASCLVEYFSTLPNAKRFFNTILGPCPYCEWEVTVDEESSRCWIGAHSLKHNQV